MAAQLGLLSLSQLEKSKEAQERQQFEAAATNHGASWMWNSKQQVVVDQESDDSWEVRAFEEDTNNAMGTTWPPRSYSCTFCRREFRSAQALGGHMNVHRRDRARLHQTPPLPSGCTTAVIMNPAHHQEVVANGGLCVFYTFPNPNAVLSPPTVINQCIESSKLHSVSPYTTNNFMPRAHSVNSSLGHSSNTEHSASTINDNCKEKDSGEFEKEIDLELRLGYGPTPS